MATMKLSEAIREGAKLRPQAMEWYTVETTNGQATTCAIGAAYEALTNQLVDSDDYGAEDITRDVEHTIENKIGRPYLFSTIVRLPENIPTFAGDQLPFGIAIATLNDDAHWTREAIADWLESEGY